MEFRANEKVGEDNVISESENDVNFHMEYCEADGDLSDSVCGDLIEDDVIDGREMNVADSGHVVRYKEEIENMNLDDGFSDIDSDGMGMKWTYGEPEIDRELIQFDKDNAGKWFEKNANGVIHLEVGQLFKDVHHFREVLRDYVIQEGFEIIRQKNEKSRVTVVCKGEGCPWRLHASPIIDKHTYKIKTYKADHTCLKKSRFLDASYSWIATKLIDKFAADPKKSRRAIQQDLIDEFGISGIKPLKLYRARQKARSLIQGDWKEQFAKCRAYGELVLEHNPGSVFYVSPYERQSIQIAPIFKRLFVMFDGVKRGFLSGCRPFLAVDACFLKGPYGGMFLSAVALDGNNGILPIAACIAETENRDSWLWFFTCLREGIGETFGDCPWTVMSDRQKGLVDAVQQVFPQVIQRYCLVHIEANFKLKFKRIDLVDKMWNAGKACNARLFQKHMKEIQDSSFEAHAWLEKIPASMWSRHAFNPCSLVDHISNNVAESLNAWINEHRDLPILTLMEEYRLKIMKRISLRHQRALEWKGKLVLKVIQLINSEWASARKIDVTSAGQGEFQCRMGSILRVVNLRTWTCDCGKWAVTGIPCKHAIACIRMKNEEVEDYVHLTYSIAAYLKVYENVIHPQPDLSVLDMPTSDIMQPPPLKRQRGRPRMNRRLQATEQLSSQRSTRLKCSICSQPGHNKRSCQRAPTQRARSYSRPNSQVL